MKKRDYHAIVTIHGLPRMKPKGVKIIADWLIESGRVLRSESKDPRIFAKKYTLRYMKV